MDKIDAVILDESFEPIAVIDTYKSFIWTDRYDEYGDFEIRIPIKQSIPKNIKKGYYLWNKHSEHVMIVETINIDSSYEEGAYFVVTGRSLESILKRRIVWHKKIFTSDDNGDLPNLQNGIKELFHMNVNEVPELVVEGDHKAIIEVRKIPNCIFEDSTDEKITSLKFSSEAQYLGEEIYEVVSKLCKENEIGFKLTLNESKQLVFKLYAGADRSYNQIENTYVVFSPKYNNVMNTNYLDSDAALKNVTLVVGNTVYDDDGNEVSRLQNVVGSAVNGLERREIFTDALSMTRDDGYGGTLSADQYEAHLKQKGIDTLIENTTVTAFDGEVDPSQMFVYGEDYFIGDIVQLANEYGQEGTAYISEFIISCDQNGVSTYPTFNTIQKGVYET